MGTCNPGMLSLRSSESKSRSVNAVAIIAPPLVSSWNGWLDCPLNICNRASLTLSASGTKLRMRREHGKEDRTPDR
eukprot:2516466-Rhodomonas_salina.3